MANGAAKRKTSKSRAEPPSAQQFTFGYLVHDVSRIRRTMMDLIMRPYDITRSQWSVLSTLSRGGNNGMTQVDLARLMEVGKVTVGGLVDRLEASGHVERRADPTDRRAKRVFITDQGYEVIRLMIDVASKANENLLADSTPEEIEVCELVLSRAKKRLKTILAEYGRPGDIIEKDEAELDREM
ncbi:MarR family transcriptional regulator (plasmid) [Sphingobium sp. SJ10-10]|uniref:MarR family winged helix-turn-helix transcriptional regulator n=1 Tax=Sphingobium sp. SJ10-10 TaxID=3114999 RepID=UPI002E172C41|nr:MarR family transcriptional regulator [Sphingobium sp. SJ10-10]